MGIPLVSELGKHERPGKNERSPSPAYRWAMQLARQRRQRHSECDQLFPSCHYQLAEQQRQFGVPLSLLVGFDPLEQRFSLLLKQNSSHLARKGACWESVYGW